MKIESWIPRTTKRVLLFIAAIIWTYAGVMLLSKGMGMMNMDPDYFQFRLAGSIVGGALFYLILFTRISKKYVNRILYLENDHPSIFAFFNLKGYVMMAGMISLGVVLRTSGIVAPFYLSIVYVTMGIPLFISSLRFYYSGIYYFSIIKNNSN